MISQFSIDYPLWSIAIPMIIGFVYAAILYWKNRKNKLSKFYNYLLFASRFIAISLISLLLLKPYVKSTNKQVQKPKLLIAVDNSQSMIASKDSNLIRNDLTLNIDNTINKFEDDYDIEILSFGSEVNFQKVDF
ncbi:MAG: hypothetical protein C0598_11825 [Marinilabiliales bacterium]|nr:MAG: hypothetical protein C0598_11825 [Marinilabiliales bacterium]